MYLFPIKGCKNGAKDNIKKIMDTIEVRNVQHVSKTWTKFKHDVLTTLEAISKLTENIRERGSVGAIDNRKAGASKMTQDDSHTRWCKMTNYEDWIKWNKETEKKRIKVLRASVANTIS